MERHLEKWNLDVAFRFAELFEGKLYFELMGPAGVMDGFPFG